MYNLSIVPNLEILTGGVALLPGEFKKTPTKCTAADREGTFAGMTQAGHSGFKRGNSTDLTMSNILSISAIARRRAVFRSRPD